MVAAASYEARVRRAVGQVPRYGLGTPARLIFMKPGFVADWQPGPKPASQASFQLGFLESIRRALLSTAMRIVKAGRKPGEFV